MVQIQTQKTYKCLQTESWNICMTSMGLVSYSTTYSLSYIIWFLSLLQCPLQWIFCWILSWAIQYPDLSVLFHNSLNLQCSLLFLGNLSSVNPFISESAPKPLLSNMGWRSVLTTKTPSFASLNFYPPMSLKALAPFGGVIKFKAVTSLWSDEGLLLKVGSFSFGLPVSECTISKPIFEITSNEDNKNISTPTHPLN